MAGLNANIATVFDKIKNMFSFQDYLQLWLRAWVARIFYDSGRMKTGEGFLEINDFQGTLFEEEYGLSFVDPEILAQITLYAETFLPLALLFGIGSRISAAGLLGMTLFIQVFVYSGHFLEHATWAIALLAVFLCGPGRIAIDSFFLKK